MVAHSPAPHGPTFTCAPSCASQRPLGSADAEPAQNSAKIVTAAAAQSLGSFMLPIFVSPGYFEQAQILTYRRLARKKSPGLPSRARLLSPLNPISAQTS